MSLQQAFSSALSTINLDALRAKFPMPKMREEYDSAQEFLKEVLYEVDTKGPIRAGTLEKLKDCEGRYQRLCERMSPTSELGSRSQLNKIYGWVDSGYVERTIYLAGMAEGKRIRQPYRTQIQLLPCNACLFRYRQVYNIWESIQADETWQVPEEATAMLELMQDAYLTQMNHFARSAYDSSDKHPLATYHMTLSLLLLSQHTRQCGDSKRAGELEEQAYMYFKQIPKPKKNMHCMYKQYYQMSHNEFSSFTRLSEKHAEIADAIRSNGEFADQLDISDLKSPRTSFEIMPYVVVGARGAVSVVTLSAAVAGVTFMEFDPLQQLLTDIWSHTINLIPGMNEADSITFANIHGGGPAMMHGGGPALV